MAQYFELFQLPEQFAVDETALGQKYRLLAAQFHPDKFVAASAFEQKQVVMMASLINQAYQILMQPFDRAAYLLQQRGINPDDPNNTHIAPDFLMQQMQWRETLAEAKMDDDAAALAQLREEVMAARADLLVQLQGDFDKNDENAACNRVRQGRFLDKMLRELN